MIAEIIVNEKNETKIADAIANAQGKATARTIDIGDVYRATQCLDKLDIPKKYKEGLAYDVDMNAQNFPNAYRFVPESTHFVLTYKKGSWRISDIRRAMCRHAGHTYECITMPDETKDAIIRSVRTF